MTTPDYEVTFRDVHVAVICRPANETLQWIHDEWLPELRRDVAVLLEMGDVPLD